VKSLSPHAIYIKQILVFTTSVVITNNNKLERTFSVI